MTGNGTAGQDWSWFLAPERGAKDKVIALSARGFAQDIDFINL